MRWTGKDDEAVRAIHELSCVILKGPTIRELMDRLGVTSTQTAFARVQRLVEMGIAVRTEGGGVVLCEDLRKHLQTMSDRRKDDD